MRLAAISSLVALIFGPFWSPRLGWTLGIEHLGPKRCTFDCGHCLAGRTQRPTLRRATVLRPAQVAERLAARLAEIDVDVAHLLLATDGEPTLDRALGHVIERLRRFALPVVVNTNGTLLSRDDVRRDLCGADEVGLRLDAASDPVWRAMHRPVAGLHRELVLQGMRVFAARFHGTLMTVTTLVGGANTTRRELEQVADLASSMQPAVAYLTVAGSRPDRSLEPADEGLLARAEAIFDQRLPQVARLRGPLVACSPRRALPRTAAVQAAG